MIFATTTFNVNKFEDYLFNILPAKGWYIAGSYALAKYKNKTNNMPDYFNDVDVFFENEEYLKEAIQKLDKLNVASYKYSTTLADSYTLNDYSIRLQLIKLHTGTKEKILPKFDLSCSRVYYTCDKELGTIDYDSRLLLNPNNIHENIFKRIQKYSNRYDLNTTDAIRTLVYEIAKDPNKKIEIF